MKQKASWKRSLRLGLMVLAGLIVYAYGFQVTQVSLDKTREPRRQESFVRILRALAHPDIFEYEKEEFVVEAPIYVPCQENMEPLQVKENEPYLTITPLCADPEDVVQVEGFNFEPNTQGPLNFIPPSGVTLQLGRITTDQDGHFIASVKLPKRQPVQGAQYIRVITRRNVGMPHLSSNGLETWRKIVETVFLALLATTFGTIFAIPISFLAARNIMKDVKSPLSSICLSLIAWPMGILLGLNIARQTSQAMHVLTQNMPINIAGLVVSPLLSWGMTRWAIPQADEAPPSKGKRIARVFALFIAALAGILSVYLFTNVAVRVGNFLSEPLGPFGFLGVFVANLGDILNTMLNAILALLGGGLVSTWLGKLGQTFTARLSKTSLLWTNLVLGALAGATLTSLISLAINWLYEFGDAQDVLWLPALLGGVGGVVLVLRTKNKEAVPIGLSIYYVMRTILNALRSIEAFIMAIIFVVLVSTGPFAGVLALSLHTVAALAKLYSEQVESILPGPLEAINATGATRMQTIVYAVIPQIIPPYISFTMYRWDINVRMSTIIGFAGGGGIGLLLQQNINLLNYRAASAQMLAITIVVALMDYVSSVLRERVV